MMLRGRPGVPNLPRPKSMPVAPAQAVSARPQYVGPSALLDGYYRVLGPDTPLNAIANSMLALYENGWKLALEEPNLCEEAVEAVTKASTLGFQSPFGAETARQILAAYGEHGCKIVRREFQ